MGFTIRSEESPRRAGFTLLELLIAMGVLGIVVVYVMQAFTASNKAYTVTDQVVESQQNLRAIGDLIEREIRGAGFMVPEGASLCGADGVLAAEAGALFGNTDQLWIADPDPIQSPDPVRTANLGARVTAGFVNATGDQTWTLDGATVDLDDDGAFFYDNQAPVGPDSDFRDDGGFILTDLNNPDRGTLCGRVRDADPGNFQVTVVRGSFNPGVAADAELVVVPANHYRVTVAMELERNRVVLARDVEDFQVAWFFDLDDDGTIDGAPEHPGNTDGTYDASNFDLRELRQVDVGLTIRSRNPDLDFAGYTQDALERPALGGAGPDNFRRRVHSASVRPRNIGQRGDS